MTDADGRKEGEIRSRDGNEHGADSAEKRVLVAGLLHQMNKFARGRVGLEDFEVRRGGEVLCDTAGASSLPGLADWPRPCVRPARSL